LPSIPSFDIKTAAKGIQRLSYNIYTCSGFTERAPILKLSKPSSFDCTDFGKACQILSISQNIQVGSTSKYSIWYEHNPCKVGCTNWQAEGQNNLDRLPFRHLSQTVRQRLTFFFDIFD